MANIITRMKAAAREQDVYIDFKHASKTELYNYALFLFEGFQVPFHISDHIFRIAEELIQERQKTVEMENIRHGLWELKQGISNLGDFMDGKELAEWLEKGEAL